MPDFWHFYPLIMRQTITVVLKSGILFIIFHFHLSAQIYFNYRYDINSEGVASFSPDILVFPGGYAVSFTSQGVNYPYGRMGFFIIDSTGNISGTPIIFEDPLMGLQTGFPGSFIKLNGNANYACVGTKMKMVPEGRYDRGWLLYMNGLLDTLWTRSYTDDPPHDTSIMFRNFRELDDAGFIVVGLLNPVSGSGLWRIGMFRTDSAGNGIWRRKYGSGNKDFQPMDVSATSDHGYVIGAEYSGTSISTQDATPYLIKTDSLGNTQWTLNLGNLDCRETDVSVDMALDGNIQVGTYYSDTCWSDFGYEARINFLKVRNDKSIAWDKKYGFARLYMAIGKIKVLPDGDVVGTGWFYYVGNGHVKPISWILRTDSAGNEKWYREYTLLNGPDSPNLLQNIVQTNDGGFAACGFVVPAQPDTGTQDSWVIKVDSLGCESLSYCWVGQDEIMVKTFTPGKPFVVFPNPSDERLTVEFHHNPDGAEIGLYDLFGRCLIRLHHPKNTQRALLDVSHLPPGVYLLRVVTGDRVCEAEKVVVR